MSASDSKIQLPKINEDDHVTTKHNLWKFHGDVENIKSNNIPGKGGWIFPDENGYVFNSFLRYIETHGLKEMMFTLVIIGYGERESEISKIIDLFEKMGKRPIYRIVLDLRYLNNEYYIVGPSDFILSRIFR